MKSSKWCKISATLEWVPFLYDSVIETIRSYVWFAGWGVQFIIGLVTSSRFVEACMVWKSHSSLLLQGHLYHQLADAVTLGGAYDRGGASFMGPCDLLQWAVGLQQQQQRRLFVLKAKVRAKCAQLGLAPVQDNVSKPKNPWREAKRTVWYMR